MPLGPECGRRENPRCPAWVPLALVLLVLGSSVAAGAAPADAPPPVGVPASAAPVDASAADAAREPAPADAAHVVWIRPEEVAVRADGLLRALEGVVPDATVRASIARVERDFGALVPDLEGLLQNARAAVTRSTPFVELDDLERELASADATLASWEGTLGAEAKRVADALDEIVRARVVWVATRARPETGAAGEVVVRRVDGALAALDEGAATLQPWRIEVLEISDRLLDRRAAVARALKRVQETTANEWRSLFVPGRPPLWEGGFVDRLRSELPRVPAQIVAYGHGTFAYVARDPRPLVVQLLVAAILMVLFRRAARAGDGRVDRGETAPRRPYALAWLLALLATPWIHPLSTQRFRQLLAIGALIPAARLALSTSGPVRVPELVGLFGLLFFDRLTLALAYLPAVARVSALVTAVLGLALAWRLARRPPAHPGPSWQRRAAHLLIVALVVALAAEIGGWDHLAALLGRGIVAGAVVALFAYAAVTSLEPLLVDALATPLVRRSHLITSDPAAVRRRVRVVLRALGALLWLGFVLRAVGLHAAAVAGLRTFLVAGVSIGALSISIGTVIAFVLTLVVAMLFARTVTGVLEEDVYPRASLPRGVPVVLSTLVRYAVYSLGFLFALAAAGIELSQLAILLGGLGVGVGLGLQDLVKNFAAGLTLLLERRVHPGDVVEIPGQEIFGRVLAIGMRATVVRGWNGSEFVVPNADLIASTITNWTLTDRLCRLEVPVGVAYGTDPERVVALLVGVARADARLLANPAPQAIFKGFGDSSLDFLLRAWTDKGIEEKVGMTSELAIAVNRALGEAGIAIPFPQRDLHLASIAPDVGAALAGREGKP